MWIEPFNNRLLVLPDIPPSKVGSIHLPENVDRPASSGEIVQISDSMKHMGVGPFRVGRKVLFMHYSGRGYMVDGVEHKIMSTSEVLAFEWDLEGKIEAHPNQILIRRDEQPIERGGNIILPDSARKAKSVMATVMAVGRDLGGVFKCGERLIIAAGVGRKVRVDKDTAFYACTASEVVARINETVETFTDLGEATEGRYKEEMEDLVYARDEGLPEEGMVRDAG